MVSPVELCNIALINLGQDQIMTLTDQVKSAQICNAMYPIIRDEMIRSHPWRRLKVRANLAFQEGQTPAFQYEFSYLLPTDLVRLLDVWVRGSIFRQAWELEENAIITNSEGPLQIRYIRDSNNPEEWDHLMVQAFAARLSLAIAEPLTQDPVKTQQAAQKFDEIEKRARSASAQEGTPVHIEQPDPWVSVRLGGALGDPTLRPISEP